MIRGAKPTSAFWVCYSRRWVQVNQKLGDIAFDQGDFETALQHYQDATRYPKNLEVAARTPDFRAHVFWYLAKVYKAMGKVDIAEDYLSRIIAEKYDGAHLGTYYQALAQRALGKESDYRSLLSKLEQEARTRTSGQFEYRGEQEAIGYYLLSLVLAEKGDAVKAAKELEQARSMAEAARTNGLKPRS